MSDISRPVIHHPAPGVAVTMDARDHVGRERTDAEALRAAERGGAVEALRNLPDHIKPNMSLVAQIDARADAIEAGADRAAATGRHRQGKVGRHDRARRAEGDQVSTVDDYFMRRLAPGWAFVIDAQGHPVLYRKSDKAAAEAARKIELAAARAATMRGRIDRPATEETA